MARENAGTANWGIGPAMVTSDPGGVTFLSGANVDLVPERLAGILLRLPGPARRRAGAVGFVAYAAGRNGLVGCRGTIERCGVGLLISDIEPFGARSGHAGFGLALAGLLRAPGRFHAVPDVIPPDDDSTGAGPLVRGMVEGGLGAADPTRHPDDQSAGWNPPAR